MKRTLTEQYGLIKKGKGHKDVFLKEAKKLSPNIDQEFLSIKSIRTSSHSMAIFGILNLDNKLIMVPLKILNTW